MLAQQESKAMFSDELDALLLREGWTLHQRLDVSPDISTPRKPAGTASILRRWREVVAPNNPVNFEKRLHWDGLTDGKAVWAIEPPEDDVPKTPEWLHLLKELRQAARSASLNNEEPQLSDCAQDQPFVHVWRPIAALMLRKLRHCCAELQDTLPLMEQAWHDLAKALLIRLSFTTEQALWEIFQQRRSPGQMLLAHLGTNDNGVPKHDAYDGLVNELLATGYDLLFEKFPVLGRLVAVVCQLWIDGSEEMLRRIAENRRELHNLFSIDPALHLREIQLGLGDPHRGGRVVAVLLFESGAGSDQRKVVYKPRDMQVDLAYQNFIEVLNGASGLPPLRCLKVYSCANYGFMEFVEHCTCSSEEQLAKFYVNAGRTLALLYLLGCTDCHYENLIANGSQLLLIDSETLLEAESSGFSNDGPNGVSQINLSLRGSVLRTGLLPHWQMAGVGRPLGYDVSALGIEPPPHESEQLGWLALNTDGMMAGYSVYPSELPTSLPVGLGSSGRLCDFVEELCKGFRLQLNEALLLRPELLKSLDHFKKLPRRYLARNTQLYYSIQRQTLQPSSLNKAVNYSFKLEQLCRKFVLARAKPLDWQLFKAEVQQIEQLDIPYFENIIDRSDLILTRDAKVISGFFSASGLSAAHRRLNELDSAEIDFQERLIRGAIAARYLRSGVKHINTGNLFATSKPFPVAPSLSSSDIRQDFHLEAFRIGEELWASAINDKLGRPEWLGLDLETDSKSFRFGLIGDGMYSGSSGLGFLFARLAQASNGTSASQWRSRSWSCFQHYDMGVEHEDKLFRLVRDLPFGLSGTGGILLALCLLQHMGMPNARRLAHSLIDQIRPEMVLADEGIDLMSGVAGLIGPLLLSDHPKALQLSMICGQRILDSQLESGGWPQSTRSHKPSPALTGFSHGAAGISASLARLAAVSGDNRIIAAAKEGLGYERSVFNLMQGNWPDYRTATDGSAFMVSWCHGAPGILLARHAIISAGLDDETCYSEIEVARHSILTFLNSSKELTRPGTCNLCCGILGLTSLMRIDAKLSGIPLDPLVGSWENEIVRRAQVDGGYKNFDAVSTNVQVPGFFSGLAGIAMSLLEASEGIRYLATALSVGLLKPLG